MALMQRNSGNGVAKSAASGVSRHGVMTNLGGGGMCVWQLVSWQHETASGVAKKSARRQAGVAVAAAADGGRQAKAAAAMTAAKAAMTMASAKRRREMAASAGGETSIINQWRRRRRKRKRDMPAAERSNINMAKKKSGIAQCENMA